MILLIIILGRLTSAFGSLDEGFHLSIAGKEKGKPISLGSEISVSVSWDVLLPDIFFYLDECSLEHGPVRVSMVKGYDLKNLKFNPSAAVATFLLQISENFICHLLALNGILSDLT